MLKIAGAALNQTPLDWKNNINNILSAINKAKQQQVELLCLPELCITGYGCEDLFLSDWIYDKAITILFEEIVPETEGIAVIIGLPIRLNNNNFNCACFINDKKVIGFYPKEFLAKDGIHYEPRWFEAWKPYRKQLIRINNEAYQFGEYLFEVKGIKIGIEICEDAWHSEERPAIRYWQKEVDIIVNPSASHFSFGKTQLRKELVINSSKKYNCTYVYANLVGNEAGRVIYDGEILIANKGELIARNQLLSFQSSHLLTNTSPSIAIDYSQEEEFERAAGLGLFDYLRKSKTSSFVLSLSGGADSSACASLVYLMVQNASKELGENIVKKLLAIPPNTTSILPHLLHTAYQGSKNSSTKTLEAASQLAASFDATFYHWQITAQVADSIKIIEKAIGRELTWQNDDIALQNIQARERSPLIWLLANIKKGLLLTTSNRSEGNVGCATMDGDTSGSIAPIAGVDKPFIRHWLRWAEKERDLKGLHAVNTLEPTAELRPQDQKQSDEDDLMPYDILKAIERLAIQKYHSPQEVFTLLKEEHLTTDEALKTYIKKFFRMWSHNQWKRERLAPSFHLDDFNIDPRSWYRFPILSGSYAEELNAL